MTIRSSSSKILLALVLLLASLSIFPLFANAQQAQDTSLAGKQLSNVSQACLTSSPSTAASSCTSTDQYWINTAIGSCNSGNNVASQCSAATANTLASLAPITSALGAGSLNTSAVTNANNQKPPSCGLTGTLDFTTCIWIPFMSTIGQVFLAFGAFILWLAGLIFDLLIQHVVIAYKNTLDTLHITDAIGTAWTVFRDFANVLIIGMFVFIAISIILGNHEYGQKKLIANVLIIAVLLNFSLLFSELIIDASNFTAYQLYGTMASANGITNGNFDMASAFLQPMGITNVWSDSGKVLDSVAKGSDSGWTAFAFGLVGCVMLIAVAAVLLYGCFLMAARAILFIFLMLVSPIAFATYLIPGMAGGKYGFNNWWKTLLNNAIFAPLLMLFLAVSLSIIRAASPAGGSAAAGVTSLFSGATTAQLTAGNLWQTILVYIIGTALLFLSFKLSSSFAGSISGFNYAALLPAKGLGALGNVTGFLGRQTIGRAGSGIGGRLQTASANPSNPMWMRNLYDFSSQRFKALGKQDFNAMRSPVGSAIAGTTGKKLDELLGKPKKGFDGTQKVRAEEYAAKADRMKLSKEDKEKLEEDTRKELLKNQPERSETYDSAKANVNAAENAVKEGEQGKSQAAEELAKATHALEQAVREQARNPGTANVEVTVRESAEAKARAQEAFNQQNARINSAKEQVKVAKSTLEWMQKNLDKDAIASGLRPAEFRSEGQLAGDLAHNRLSNLILRSAGFSTRENDKLAKLAEKEVGEHHKKHNIKEALKTMQNVAGHDDHGATPAAHAPADAAHPPADQGAAAGGHAPGH